MKTPELQAAEAILGLAMSCQEHDIFVEYSAHIESISVRVYPGGWETGIEPAKWWTVDAADTEQLHIELLSYLATLDTEAVRTARRAAMRAEAARLLELAERT